MNIAHTIWDTRGHLLLWGEKIADYRDTPNPNSEISSNEEITHHPFAFSSEELSSKYEELDLLAEATTTTVFLPTYSNTPLPSVNDPVVSSTLAQSDEEVIYKEWRVPALALDPIDTLNFLTLPASELPQDMHRSHSTTFWREATKLLLEFLTRGRFLPGIQRIQGKWVSSWHIVPEYDEDHERINILQQNMPAICKAQPENVKKLPVRILDSFLSEMADSTIRTFLSRVNLTEEIENQRLLSRQKLPYAWLSKLTQREKSVDGDEYELLELERKLTDWSKAEFSPPTQIISCLRLRSPQEAGTNNEQDPQWLLEFLVRIDDSPQGLIPAAKLWETGETALDMAQTIVEDLGETLLKHLGGASHHYPKLREALESPFPTHLTLDTTGAYHFLKEISQHLSHQGLEVILPSWWNKPSLELGLRLQLHEPQSGEGGFEHTGSFLSQSQLLDYSWKITIGDQVLDIQKLRQLVDNKTPLIEINGQWVELDPEKMKGTLAFLDSKKAGSKIHLLEALKLGFGLSQEKSVVPIVDIVADGWVRTLLNAQSQTIPLLEEPRDFIGKLWPYQKQGLSWLSFLGQFGIGGCLADDMGLGKTVQLLALLLYEREDKNERVLPTLLVVPMSILANWTQEAEKFAPTLNIYTHHGVGRTDGQDFIDTCYTSDVIVTTYSLLSRDEALFSQIDWGRIALDEAQNIKNLSTKQTKVVRELVKHSHREENTAPPCHRVALTGTPLENKLDELWSIFDFLNPGFLGSLKQFRTQFVLPIERYRDKKAEERLSKLIKPFVLRRLKSDPNIIEDLPEKIEINVPTGLTAEQETLYEEAMSKMLPQVDKASGIHRRGLILATITHLKQICNHPALFLKDKIVGNNRSAKLQRLEELLEVILAEGDKVLIFTQFAQMGHLLKPYLQDKFKKEVFFLHGALAQSAREKMLTSFRKKEGPAVFILSLKAGGFGLNLTEANQVVHYDQWWNPAVEAQATDRAYRIGQKKTVQVRKLICQGTLEEKIQEMPRT